MKLDHVGMNHLLKELIELIEIPPSHYVLAIGRYDSLSKWLNRKESLLYGYNPHVCSQGSFRYGTVIRPLLPGEYYDLDLVCQVDVSKAKFTQKQLRELVGKEIELYAKVHNFNEPPEPKRRCWRLNYADHVSFHMDILPAAPDDANFIAALIAAGVEPEFAQLAVGITDTTHPYFDVISNDWPRSNPRGIGRWFERQMRVESFTRRQALVEATLYASVDDVPVYEWKTPLQRSIQILKRHRDVMFQDEPDLKPISMILTTLAARAYAGESNLYDALTNILNRMPTYVNRTRPRVPNPVNPAEDFADRWHNNPELEDNFWAWHKQAQSDLAGLPSLSGGALDDTLERRFDVKRPSSQPTVSPRSTGPAVPAVHVASAAPAVRIATPPRPWGN